MICLGTWQSKPEEVVHAVEYALKEAGYRHIDCAWCVQLIEFAQIISLTTFRMYGNEKEVGEGIRRSGVPRKEIFVRIELCILSQQAKLLNTSCDADYQ